MNISSIGNIKFNYNNYIRHSHKMSDVILAEQDEKLDKQKVYATNIAFKSSIQMGALINDYKWFVRNDRVPAVQAFLKIKAPKESLEGLLKYILNNNETSYEFIDSIVQNPRQAKVLSTCIKEMLPEYSNLINFYTPQNPYYEAYERYIDARVNNAQSISELLKIRPDWKEDVLLNKHRQIYHNDNFEIGVVPESIGRENFKPLIEYLTMFADYGFKIRKDIKDFEINGRRFKLRNFIDGKSNKNVFEVEAENGKKYIIKIGRPEEKGINKPFSIGTCCIIDSYLTQNNCRNSAPLRYYNHNLNVAIYDYINHSLVPKMTQLQEFSATMPDFDDLCLSHNDTVGNNNYFLLDNSQKVMENTYDYNYGVNHGELISVDNDHVTYNHPLQPIINKYHAYLPCEMQMFF